MEQAEGFSADEQESRCRELAGADAQVYCDIGFSGSTLDRPALQKLISDVEAHKVKCIYIYALDRLSRYTEGTLQLMRIFNEYDTPIKSIYQDIDNATPTGRFTLTVNAAVSELERQTIRARMEMGRTGKARQGICEPGSKGLFGFFITGHRKNVRLTPDPDTAPLVKEIFEKYLEGYTLSRLSAWWDAEHPEIKDYHYARTAFKNILKNERYAGYFRFKGELIKAVNIEPIISYDLYLQVQKAMDKRNTTKTRVSSNYILTGLMLCGQCGCRYVGKMSKQNVTNKKGEPVTYKIRRYGCQSRVKPDPQFHSGCKNKIYRADDLEQYVLDFVKNVKLVEHDGTSSLAASYIDTLYETNANLAKQKERATDLFIKGFIDEVELANKVSPINAEIENNKKLITEEKNKIIQAPPDALKTMQDDIDNIENLPYNKQKILLSYLIDNIVIDGEDVRVKLRFV